MSFLFLICVSAGYRLLDTNSYCGPSSFPETVRRFPLEILLYRGSMWSTTTKYAQCAHTEYFLRARIERHLSAHLLQQ